jgi:hypothetical protein
MFENLKKEQKDDEKLCIFCEYVSSAGMHIGVNGAIPWSQRKP